MCAGTRARGLPNYPEERTDYKAMKARQIFVNQFAREAKSPEEAACWSEAAYFAAELYKLAKLANAYHNGGSSRAVSPQPVSVQLLHAATRFALVENAAITVRVCRYSESKKAPSKEVKMLRGMR